MGIKLETDSNPFQPPVGDSQANLRPNSSSGLKWLLGGVGILMGCLFILGYLMLLEVPCIKANHYDGQNVNLPFDLSIALYAVDFVFQYWFILVIVTIVPLVMIEAYCSVDRKRKVRRSLGIVIGIVSLAFTFWIVWVTVSAIQWDVSYWA